MCPTSRIKGNAGYGKLTIVGVNSHLNPCVIITDWMNHVEIRNINFYAYNAKIINPLGATGFFADSPEFIAINNDNIISIKVIGL